MLNHNENTDISIFNIMVPYKCIAIKQRKRLLRAVQKFCISTVS